SNSMSEHRHGEGLEIFGNAEAAAVEESHGLGGTIEHLRSARRNAKSQLFVLASAGDDFESVIHQGIVNFHLGDNLLHFKDVGAAQYWFKVFELRRASFGPKNLSL